MFRYPKNLFDNFNKLKFSEVVKNKAHTDEALKEFETYLNDAQPACEADYQLELFTKNLYRGKNDLFINCIKNRSAECLVLWTESKAIVRFFQLYGVIYIQYDKETHRYNVSRHRRIDNPNYQPPQNNYNYNNNNNHRNNRYNNNNGGGSDSLDNNLQNYPNLQTYSQNNNGNSKQFKSSSSPMNFRDRLVSQLMSEVSGSSSSSSSSSSSIATPTPITSAKLDDSEVETSVQVEGSTEN